MKRRPAEGETVAIDYRNIFGAGNNPNWRPGVVESVLATQFTAVIQDETYGEQTVFRSYQDQGKTWEFDDA